MPRPPAGVSLPARRRFVLSACPLPPKAAQPVRRGLFLVSCDLPPGHHPNANTSCESRLAATSQYFSEISMPMAFRPRFFAATSVVPLPMNGSRIMFASGTAAKHHFISASGFCVGCQRSCSTAINPEPLKRNIFTDVPPKLVHANSASEKEGIVWHLSQTSHFLPNGRNGEK